MASIRWSSTEINYILRTHHWLPSEARELKRWENLLTCVLRQSGERTNKIHNLWCHRSVLPIQCNLWQRFCKLVQCRHTYRVSMHENASPPWRNHNSWQSERGMKYRKRHLQSTKKYRSTLSNQAKAVPLSLWTCQEGRQTSEMKRKQILCTSKKHAQTGESPSEQVSPPKRKKNY